MHICLVMAGDEDGGLEKHVVELANGLVKYGHKVTLIAHEKYQSRVDGVDFKALDLSKGRRNLILLWQLYHLVKSIRADVLHVHANKAVTMIAPFLTWLKIPSVATLHNFKRNITAFEKFDRVIAVSQSVANQFSNQQKVRVVLNGVSVPKNEVSEKKINSNIQALAIGRLVPAKGFDLLIEAWQGISANLIIIGDGPDRESLQQQIDLLGLQQNIQLLGHRSDVNELLYKSDILVISSRNEGGPYTLSEALLSNRPVISTNVGMVSDILPFEFICPIQDVLALHNLIEKHFSNFKDLEQSFKPIYELAKQNLTIDAMLEHTVQVYQELIRG
ncbi:glycosyltransferase [Acinetobacter sp. SwsAc5]|uniref:glycosyltransferase n=1 Tax=Acinetobacter sp. SwsAc5 TaxID=2749438 RepID=UPI0015BAA16A|nr:glycosyltransferase [Acinetobacter sp. SwsAc5]NWK53156.1 glycosyltransferase [Acinetobacter sp. SwsAc5]